jgi:single-strand DNA-binding protein
MGSVNKVILVGNLTRDPEMKQPEGKKPVCIIGLATNRHWTDDKGHRHEEPEFHRMVA